MTKNIKMVKKASIVKKELIIQNKIIHLQQPLIYNLLKYYL